MHTYTPTVTPDTSDQLITASQAARLLAAHISTVRRWITKGKLPAYRVGERGVRLRYGDVVQLITPVRNDEEKGGRMSKAEQYGIRPLTPQQQAQARRAIAEARRLRAEMLKQRGGKLFPDSAALIREMREERTRQLMREAQE